MKSLAESKTLFFYFLVTLCLIVSFNYRNKNYSSYPPVYDTFDEYAAAWNGLSILRTGVPTSWSYIPDYARGIPKHAKLDLKGMNIWVNNINPTSNYKNFPKPVLLVKQFTLEGYTSYFNVVSPYLEQPPLGSIIIALPAYLNGVKNFGSVTLALIRKQFIYIGVFSNLILILIAKKYFNKKVAILSGILYATIPTVGIGSRLALPENLLTLLFLLEIFFLPTNRRISYAIAFLAPLIKPFGLALPLFGGIYFYLVKDDYKLAINFLAIGVLSFASYVCYGLMIDRKTFLLVLTYQSNRFFSGPEVFLVKILIPKITKIFLDGWIFFGWICVFILAFSKRLQKFWIIILPIMSYVLITSFFGGEDYGWYRLPLYPFIILAAGVVISNMLEELNIFSLFLFIFAVFLPNLTWGLNIYNWSNHLLLFRIVLCILGVVLIPKRTRKMVFILLLIISIMINTRIINNIGKIWPYLGDKNSLIIGR